MVMADQGGGGNSMAASVAVMRDYRKGNWTVLETMVLIEAKKMDDERRMRIRATGAGGEPGSSGSGVTANRSSEPRWKWVEDYCWRKECFRSQNQCNDKWDNLMRDYKKVRDYERRRRSTAGDDSASEDLSYWKMEKAERKDRNLPTNLLPQIYEALVDVVERKLGGGSSGGGPSVALALPGSGSTAASSHHQPPGASGAGMSLQPVASSLLPPIPLPPQYASAPVLLALPPQTSPTTEAPQRPQPFPSPIERSDTSDSETNEHSHSSPAKRRRRIARAVGGPEEEGKRAAAAASSGGTSSYEAVGTAISRSASIIAEALQACDEREERRHRDLLGIQERRLKLEESNAETNKQGINGLVDAINKLADSIHALAASSSSKNQSSAPE
ncbi:trihelix transcription factor ASR3 [Punica granatum]|uniref:Myb-like domain-containing protein n=2 Tax=Punica granatum TaxID=22663 RepID=A0A218WPY4_PUNGR|nr:trihelix transcription factor ASR3 [Punica granatum]OWM74696.1 hypothetical protein CDL15_Pgr004659 [Punica granatum]PKI63880.1 hypothetical protein CRG98_015716 [Punica granatum]